VKIPSAKNHVSVIVPVFNGSAHIRQALLSVLRELHPHDELIVVDDCSTDNSCQLIEIVQSSDPHNRVQLLRNPNNVGPAAARNSAIIQASREIIMSIDQDDLWCNGHRDALVVGLHSARIAIGRQSFVLLESEELEKSKKWWRDAWLDQPQRAYVFGASAIYRDCFEEYGLLDPQLRFGCDDVEWFGRSRQENVKVKEIDEVVLVRKIHGSNLSANGNYHRELIGVLRSRLSKPEI
jgi:glycosyltransferase involved in cell wall biosynthesis